MKNEVKIALNICTFQREEFIHRNLSLLQASDFFNPDNPQYYGRLHIFVVDNGSSLQLPESPYVHCIYNLSLIHIYNQQEKEKRSASPMLISATLRIEKRIIANEFSTIFDSIKNSKKDMLAVIRCKEDVYKRQCVYRSYT